MTFIFIIIIKDADQNVKNKKSYKDNLTVFFKKNTYDTFIWKAQRTGICPLCAEMMQMFFIYFLYWGKRASIMQKSNLCGKISIVTGISF